MSATAGKVALVNGTTALTGANPAAGTTVVDFVGYGSTASGYEGTGPTATLSATTAALRASSGCTDTNQNASDFTVGPPVPRNSSTTVAPCSTTSPTLTASPTSLTGFTYVAGGGPSASQSFSLSGSNLTAGSISIAGSTNYEVSADNTNFGSSVTLTNTAGTLASTPVYVRLKAGLSTGSYNNETIAVSGGGTTSNTNVTVSGSVTAPTPVLTVNPASLTGFSTAAGTPSTAQSYVLTGSNVTAAVTVSAPTGFAVSLNNSTYTNNVSVTAANVNGSGQTIYVRLTGAAAGSFSGNVGNATTGATTVNVAVSGTVTPAPVLSVSPGSLTAFNTLAGAASAAQSYALTGSNLTANVIVTAPTGYEVSQTSATAGFAATQTVAPASGSVSATLYVRLTATAAAGTPSGNISNASTGANTQNVAVSGTVVGKPTGTPAITAGTPTATSVTLNLSAADGTNLLVVVRLASSAATAPTDGTTYSASSAAGSGQALGSGYVVFAAPNATSVTVTGLNPATTYAADIYTYNRGTANGFESYGAASGTTSFTTAVQVASAPGLLLLEEDFDYASGTALVASTATTGWQRITANGSNVAITTVSGNQTRFTYPQGNVFATVNPATSSQASVAGGSSAEDIYKTFGTAQPSGNNMLYAAALINLSSVTGTGAEYFLAFNNGGTTAVGRVFAQAAVNPSDNSNGYQLGVTGNNSTAVAANFSSTVLRFGATYVVVLKVDNSSGTDQASLFVFDNSTTTTLPLTEPATPSAGPVSSGSSTSQLALMTSVFLRQASGSFPTLTIDNLRVASGWGSAIGFPVFTAASATVNAGSYYGLRVSGATARATTSGPVALEKVLDLDGGVLATTAASPVRLRYRAPATPADDFQLLTAASNTGYVDGPVAREAAAGAGPSLVFPIGRSGNYRPLTLNIDNAPQAATLYTASQTEGRPADQTLNAPLARISRVRYYTLTPDPVPPAAGTAGAFSGNVELSFGADDGVTDPASVDFVVAKNSNDGTHWLSINRQSNTSSTLKSGSFQSFSDFILGNTDPAIAANPLPVQLTSFAATRLAKGGVALAWATASELNSARFEVERSLDGQTFGRVATVAAQGSSAQAHEYAAQDAGAPLGQLYYRLRMVDVDGTAAYSPVATVTAGAAGELTLAPNPAHDQLGVFTEATTAYTVRNALGQAVRAGTTRPGATTLDVSELPAGVYLFELHSSAGRVVRRFSKE